MNILVIGNGFDLAHGLPTTYKNFLDYAHIFKYYNEEENKEAYLFPDKYKNYKAYILDLFKTSLTDEKKGRIFNELEELIEDNKWLNYFWEINEDGGWIDFEKEISRVIQALDSARKDRNSQLEKNAEVSKIEFKKCDEIILQNVMGKSKAVDLKNIEEIKENLIEDLNRLIRCLEIYLCDYVGKIEIKVKLPDIIDQSIDHVLSFNYTNTFEKIYGLGKKNIKYDYIHGKIKGDSNIEDSNLILGIDEYLENEDEQRKDNEFIQFKKFYQRIYKKTGCGYTNWIDNAAIYTPSISSPALRNNIYILGHSLDITDGDILSELIMMEKTKTTIFYHNKKALESQICNLVKIIGEKKLIEKTNGKNADIVFIQQRDPLEV